MSYEIVTGPAEHSFKIEHSVFAPFYNLWGHTSCFLRGPFDLDILDASAASTSGSPAVATGRRFAGFLTPAGGRVVSDGTRVTCFVPENQKLLVVDGLDERDAWRLYNAQVEAPAPPPAAEQPHWRLPEYVTWVEQKAVAAEKGCSPLDCLDDAFVRRYARRILDLGLPPGKLTIDAGWQQHRTPLQTDGYWRVATDLFPHLPGLCHWLEDRGFAPGLWFGLPRVQAGGALLEDRPELFEPSLRRSVEENTEVTGAFYHEPSPALVDFYREIFRPYVAMGFRKFKLDYYYGPRQRMTELIRCAYEAITSLDPTVEVESHHPDIFFSRWVHAVRANDVNILPGWDWQGLTLAHLRVCELCAPDRLINLDHAGGNEPSVSELDFIRHLRLFDVYAELRAYPVVSLLPDRFSARAVDALQAYIEGVMNKPAAAHAS